MSGRIARRMPWSRVTLRRRSDRIQAWLTLTLILGALVGAPWVAWWVAGTTYRDEVRAGAWERQHHHPVAAVLTQDASGRAGPGGDVPPAPARVSAPAYWTGPDGLTHAGVVTVEVGTRSGSTVSIWIDDHGSLVTAPRRRNPVLGATIAGTLTLVASAALLSGVRRVVVWRLDRRRLRSWEAEWRIVGPLWSRR